MRILIVTDAWFPQVNGVVVTLSNVAKQLAGQGHDVFCITPQAFKTLPLPSYPEIKMAWNTWKVGPMIRKFNPDAIHIATPEGSLGIAARCYCIWHNLPYTSSYHTKMPEYIHVRYKIPIKWTYAFMRWAHKRSKAVLVTTPSMLRELKDHKFKPRLVVWTRGADYELFNPTKRQDRIYPIKMLTYVGRVSVEKNIEAFLQTNVPMTMKVVVGGGPMLEELKAKYPDVNFLGYQHGEELARSMANADVFVFPSKTDTFGIVMIEAAGSGTPVAAYPVTGPIDFVREGVNGSLNENLEEAIKTALKISRESCHDFTVANYSWEKCAKIFFDTLAVIHR